MYVSHSSGPPGSVSSYSPKGGNLLEQFQAGSETITALKLSAAGDKLLTTSGGPKLHQYSIVGREPVATTMVAAAGAAKGGQRGVTGRPFCHTSSGHLSRLLRVEEIHSHAQDPSFSLQACPGQHRTGSGSRTTDSQPRARLYVVAHDTTPAGGSRCHGLDVNKDGSVVIACKSCVFHVSPSGAPSGSKFCPAGNSTALKHIALDPTNKFFYVADGNSNVVHKVSLKDWTSTANFTVPGARKIHGLVVLRRIDEVAFREGRKRSEAEWWHAVSKAMHELSARGLGSAGILAGPGIAAGRALGSNCAEVAAGRLLVPDLACADQHAG